MHSTLDHQHMHELSTPNFFSLEECPFPELFKDSFYVWEALSKLSAFFQKQQLGKIEVDIPSSVHLIQPELISIGKGTVVEPGALIRGPCIIGKDCEVRHGAYIRGFVITGNGCIIG